MAGKSMTLSKNRKNTIMIFGQQQKIKERSVAVAEESDEMRTSTSSSEESESKPTTVVDANRSGQDYRSRNEYSQDQSPDTSVGRQERKSMFQTMTGQSNTKLLDETDSIHSQQEVLMDTNTDISNQQQSKDKKKKNKKKDKAPKRLGPLVLRMKKIDIETIYP